MHALAFHCNPSFLLQSVSLFIAAVSALKTDVMLPSQELNLAVVSVTTSCCTLLRTNHAGYVALGTKMGLSRSKNTPAVPANYWRQASGHRQQSPDYRCCFCLWIPVWKHSRDTSYLHFAATRNALRAFPEFRSPRLCGVVCTEAVPVLRLDTAFAKQLKFASS